jgi:hypothetical protein
MVSGSSLKGALLHSYFFLDIFISFFLTNTYLSNRESFLFGIFGGDSLRGYFIEGKHGEFIQGKDCSSAQFHCLGHACDFHVFTPFLPDGTGYEERKPE